MSFIKLKEENERLCREEKRLQKVDSKSMPITAVIETTNKCNADCIMCPFSSRIVPHTDDSIRHRATVMDFDLFEKIAHELFPYVKYFCPTHTGEPFMNENFYKQLDLVEKYDVKLVLLTNGILIPKGEKLDRLVRNLHEVIISFNGARKETLERIERVNGYERIIGNIERFNKARNVLKGSDRPNLVLKIVLLKSNIKELCDWIRLAKRLEADYIEVCYGIVCDERIEDESLFLHQESANYYIKRARKLAEKLKIGVRDFPAMFLKHPTNKIESESGGYKPCRFLWEEVYIHLNGNVYVCCGGYGQDNLLIGNMRGERFKEIWCGKRHRVLKGGFKTGNMSSRCRTCYHRIGVDQWSEETFIIYKGFDRRPGVESCELFLSSH